MPTPTETLKFELLQADDYSQYFLHEPLEILQILRGLVQKRAMITAYLDGGGQSFLTTILHLDEANHRLALDLCTDESINQRVLTSEQLVCATQLEQVKIQFLLSRLERIPHENFTAFWSSFPELLLRLQRREYYRLSAPVSHALTCRIPVALENTPVETYEARIVDISGGGVAVMVPPKGISFEPNQEFPGCTILLPDVGPIQATLRVCNVFRLTNRQGITMLRAGCQFIGLAEAMNTAIHRYILRVERERGARERGY